jgi:hypothetical protein
MVYGLGHSQMLHLRVGKHLVHAVDRAGRHSALVRLAKIGLTWLQTSSRRSVRASIVA